ncbi:SurA N-terminal domain-containing protein [Tenggerimyces flavus]|uniref:SurA N-terminal domain-containing protein n=1 Tax=Tenggerimyces flavus TaxID=1708749 RepID=A0ABV7Y820_9ACTN|nr:SurA N-terminal domain-containing protein [Tenggerimyces flavus]MBM7785679.1 hypothetical protein [Tenggerimyces flavus]
MIRKPRAALAAIGLAAALGLAGCGGLGAAGMAAEVDGQTITVEYVQKQAKDMAELTKRESAADLKSNQQLVLGNLVGQHLVNAAATTAEVEVTDADVSKLVADLKKQTQQILQNNGTPPPPDMLEGYARYVLLLDKLAAKLLGKELDPESQADQEKAQQLLAVEITKTAKRVGVKVNPRFGKWNGTSITPEGGDLVKITPPEGAAPEAPAGS